jgi:hypothetical protein
VPGSRRSLFRTDESGPKLDGELWLSTPPEGWDSCDRRSARCQDDPRNSGLQVVAGRQIDVHSCLVRDHSQLAAFPASSVECPDRCPSRPADARVEFAAQLGSGLTPGGPDRERAEPGQSSSAWSSRHPVQHGSEKVPGLGGADGTGRPPPSGRPGGPITLLALPLIIPQGGVRAITWSNPTDLRRRMSILPDSVPAGPRNVRSRKDTECGGAREPHSVRSAIALNSGDEEVQKVDGCRRGGLWR